MIKDWKITLSKKGYNPCKKICKLCDAIKERVELLFFMVILVMLGTLLALTAITQNSDLIFKLYNIPILYSILWGILWFVVSPLSNKVMKMINKYYIPYKLFKLKEDRKLRKNI